MPALLAAVAIFLAMVQPANSLSLAKSTLGTGLKGKLIAGYQGWFGCPDDFENNKLWQHWFKKGIAPENFIVDMLPSVRTIDAADLCDTGLRRSDGSTIRLYSAQNERVVAAHFRWMRDYGIDGAAVQRFVLEFTDPAKVRRSDHVLNNVRAAAEAAGRVFFLSYDVSGSDPATVVGNIRNDWRHLAQDLKIIDSPSYLHDRGKPVLEIWGFGFGDRPGMPGEVSELINDLKNGRGGLSAATLIGGVPTHWRTLSGDSKSDPAWAAVYRNYDVISPWSVGRFSDDAGADAFVRDNVLPDMAETKRLGIGYLPVIYPGFSWFNLMTNRNKPSQAVLNRTPRRCGTFLWRQVSNLLDAKVDMLYAAMFDEVDEGTALFPVETRMDRLPTGAQMVFLDQDGCSLPDDWYLRITGKAAEYLHNEEVPSKILDLALKPRYKFTIDPDIAYGPDSLEKLDLCLPQTIGMVHPALVLIHGGGWTAGDKKTYNKLCGQYASMGIVAVSINYRLFAAGTGANSWPAQIIDAQLAVRWLRQHAIDLRIDTQKICAYGDSAGGHLALLLGMLTKQWPGDRDNIFPDQSSSVACVIDNFGPTDLERSSLPLLKTAKQLVPANKNGVKNALKEASPLFHVHPSAASTLIIQGRDDELVPRLQSIALRDALLRYGVNVKYLEYPGGHQYKGLSSSDMRTIHDEQACFILSCGKSNAISR